MNNFEYATRYGLRFESTQGLLTVEDLWKLPLTSTKSSSLDSIGQGIRRRLRATEEDSLVTPKDTQATKGLTIMFEIVKHIIDVKQAESASKRMRAEKKLQEERLKEILAKKQAESLENLTEEEIRSRLAELSAETE